MSQNFLLEPARVLSYVSLGKYDIGAGIVF